MIPAVVFSLESIPLISVVDDELSSVPIVGKNILGAAALVLADDEPQEVAEASEKVPGNPGLTRVADAVVTSIGQLGSTRTEKGLIRIQCHEEDGRWMRGW